MGGKSNSAVESATSRFVLFEHFELELGAATLHLDVYDEFMENKNSRSGNEMKLKSV